VAGGGVGVGLWWGCWGGGGGEETGVCLCAFGIGRRFGRARKHQGVAGRRASSAAVGTWVEWESLSRKGSRARKGGGLLWGRRRQARS